MKNQLLTAICFFSPKEGKTPRKYRNINGVEKFMKFAKDEGFLYVNFYSKETKEFIERKWINDN